MRNRIKELLKEYITKDEVYLLNYFKESEESRKQYLPQEYYYFFEDFLIEEDIDFEKPKDYFPSNTEGEPDEEQDMFDNDLELMIWLENNNKEIYDKFGDYLYEKLRNNTLPIPEQEYPAWVYFDNNPEIVKNQWLIHFTKDANSIANEGFKYGVDEIEKLGLTTWLSDYEKKYGGYNFAYLLSDFKRYGYKGYNKYKYGDECVIFRASGVKLWHYGDEEYQVIFYGKTASNIIPIDFYNGEWYIANNKTLKLLYSNEDLEKVVMWLTKNYNQYKNVI
jgi:hypothetical protein